MKRLHPGLPFLVIAAGVVTLLASTLTDEDEETPPVPVTVNYSLQTQTSLRRDLETRNGIVSAMQLTGSYSGNSGDGLTLDREIVNLGGGSSFTLEIDPRGDEQLSGTAEVEITSDLDFGLDRDPTIGGLSILRDGTTSTDVEVTSSGVDLFIGDATTALSLGWSDFEAREDDADAILDERMASAAYNMLSAIVRAALLVEGIVSDFENNSDMIESMAPETLEMACDNGANGAGDPDVVRLTWTDDETGDGQGDLGINDFFDAFYRNCLLRGRYLDGRAELDDYIPDRGDGLRRLRVRAELFDFFDSTVAVTGGVTGASADSPRYIGRLSLDYTERDSTP